MFMCKCAKNEKQLTSESGYDFCVIIFVFTADDTTVDKNEDVNGDYIKQ